MRFRICIAELSLPNASNHGFSEPSNALAALPPGENPKYRIAGPKLRIMDKQIRGLDNVLEKLVSLKLLVSRDLFRPTLRARKSFWNG